MLDKLSKGEGPWFLQWLYNNLLGLSQTISTRLGGDPDESVSGRTGRAEREGSGFALYVMGPFINGLTADPFHTADSVEPEEKREKEIWDWGKESIRPRHMVMIMFLASEWGLKGYGVYLIARETLL